MNWWILRRLSHLTRFFHKVFPPLKLKKPESSEAIQSVHEYIAGNRKSLLNKPHELYIPYTMILSQIGSIEVKTFKYSKHKIHRHWSQHTNFTWQLLLSSTTKCRPPPSKLSNFHKLISSPQVRKPYFLNLKYSYFQMLSLVWGNIWLQYSHNYYDQLKERRQILTLNMQN
jgi:hypothetical protein